MTHNVNDFSKVFALSHMITGFPFALLFTDFFPPIFAILLFIFFSIHIYLLRIWSVYVR